MNEVGQRRELRPTDTIVVLVHKDGVQFVLAVPMEEKDIPEKERTEVEVDIGATIWREERRIIHARIEVDKYLNPYNQAVENVAECLGLKKACKIWDLDNNVVVEGFLRKKRVV
jgi:hypothetical protein